MERAWKKIKQVFNCDGWIHDEVFTCFICLVYALLMTCLHLTRFSYSSFTNNSKQFLGVPYALTLNDVFGQPLSQGFEEEKPTPTKR